MDLHPIENIKKTRATLVTSLRKYFKNNENKMIEYDKNVFDFLDNGYWKILKGVREEIQGVSNLKDKTKREEEEHQWIFNL